MNDRNMNQISQSYATLIAEILDVIYYITDKKSFVFGMWNFSNVMSALWG